MPRRITEQALSGYTLELFKGIAFTRTFQYTDANGDPISLVGKDIKLGIKDVFPDLLTITTSTPSILGSEVSILNAVEGRFKIKITDEETLSGTVTKTGRWWLELIDGSDPYLLWRDDVTLDEL